MARGIGALLLALLFSGASACATCFADRSVRFADAILLPVQHCYETEHGLIVDASPLTECPARVTVEAITADLFKVTGMPDAALRGSSVLFVDFPLMCAGVFTQGCTAGSHSAVRKTVSWPIILRHELGHQVHLSLKDDSDPSHIDCYFWRRVDGRYCEDWSGTEL